MSNFYVQIIIDLRKIFIFL